MKYLFMLVGLGIGLIAGDNIPSWYFNPPLDNETSWYGVGEGSSLRQAKENALIDVASKLSVTISSKISNTTTQITTGAATLLNKNVNINQESEVKKISFNDVEVLSSTHNDTKALVLVGVNKAKFLSDQARTLNDTVKDIKALKAISVDKSILERYQKFQAIAPDVEKAKTIISILATFDPSFNRMQMINIMRDYRDSMDDIRSQIEFYIDFNHDSHYSADILKEALGFEKIKIAQRLNHNNLNIVIVGLNTKATKKELFGSYMVNMRTTVSLKSNNNSTLSSFIVESKGSSTLDYETALKNASKNFKQTVNEKGIFSFLGI